MLCRLNRFVRPIFALLTFGIAIGSYAQAHRSADDYPDSKVDIYAGYGYWHPIDSGVDGKQFMNVSNLNATASVGYYFSRFLGVQIEGSYFSGSGEHRQYGGCVSGASCDQLVYTGEAGPILRFPLGRFQPFVHVLGGGERTNGPAAQPLTWGWGVTGGGGLDYILPFWNKRFALRLVQADFQYSQVTYGPLVLPAGIKGGQADVDALKLSGGLVVRFGEPEVKQAVMLGCSAEPSSVHPGDPITVTGSTLYLDSRKKPNYTWNTNGGKLTPSGATATIDTSGLAPGEYTVNGHVSQGPKPRQQASCNAPFRVLPIEPPSLTCSANPNAVPSGATVDISTVGTSPQNRPLTYSFTASAGTITGTGSTAKLATAGLGATNITVTCNAVDDLGQAAQATTGVTVSVPPPPVVSSSQPLCSISFTRDTKRPVRVDNEAKACLDDIALTMTQQTDAKLEIIGDADPSENPEAAAERAMNARDYLTHEKAIPASRIEVRVGDTSGRNTRDVLVPAGATFDDANTQLFDEKSIARHGQAYGTAGHGTTTAHKPVRKKKPVAVAPAADTSGVAPPQ